MFYVKRLAGVNSRLRLQHPKHLESGECKEPQSLSCNQLFEAELFK